MDNIDFEQEYRTAARNLNMFNLSEYELRAYISLIIHGYGSAETVAKTANIPRTSAYKVLQSLSDMGFAYGTKGRPRIFKPESPDRLRKVGADMVAATFNRLEEISDLLSDRGEPQLVYTITGRDRVVKKICEIIDKTEEYMVISTPSFTVFKKDIEKKLINAINRKVEITLITERSGRLPDGIQIIKRKQLIATDIVSDGQIAFIADSSLDTCGYTENPLLAKHVERFLVISMDA